MGHGEACAEVEHGKAAVVEESEVAGVRVAVQPGHAGWARQEKSGQRQPGTVALLPRAGAGDLRHGRTVHPVGHQHPVGDLDHARHVEVGVATEGLRELGLCRGLLTIVDLGGPPMRELGEERLRVRRAAIRSSGLSRSGCSRSVASASPAWGYCTFTATWRLSSQTARCTLPMLAAADGSSSNC